MNIKNMVQKFLVDLGATSINYEATVELALGVAAEQLRYAQHEIGVALKEKKQCLVKLEELSEAQNQEELDVVRSRLAELEAYLSDRKQHASVLSLGLDEINDMYKATDLYRRRMTS